MTNAYLQYVFLAGFHSYVAVRITRCLAIPCQHDSDCVYPRPCFGGFCACAFPPSSTLDAFFLKEASLKDPP